MASDAATAASAKNLVSDHPVNAVAAENPPLHLALGNDALGVMRKKIASLQQDISAWEATSASVVFPQS